MLQKTYTQIGCHIVLQLACKVNNGQVSRTLHSELSSLYFEFLPNKTLIYKSSSQIMYMRDNVEY